MKILVINQWFPPEFAPIGVMLKEMSEDLVKMGHQVTVVTGFPNHPKGIVFPGYVKKFSTTEVVAGVRIIRCYLYTSPKKTVLRRLVNYCTFALSAFMAAVRISSVDAILTVSPPLSNGLLGVLLKKWHRAAVILNVQDIYPDAAIAAKVIRNKHLIKVLRLLEKYIYRNCSAVSVISTGFRNNLNRKGVPDDRIVLVPNWLDSEEIVPLGQHNPFSVRHGLVDKFVVLYAGTVGIISGAEIILPTAKILLKNKDIIFLVVGEGAVKAMIEEEAARCGLHNIMFLPFQAREELSHVQATASVSVVTLKTGQGASSVPSKVLGYMAAARPVVASVDVSCDTAELVSAAHCGVIVPPEDSAALADAILDLYHDPHKATLLGQNGRRYLEEHFSRKSATQKYEQVLVTSTGSVR